MNTTKETIQKKQNEDLLLKIQFSARDKYNKAECINNISWIACFLSAASVFIPNNTKLCLQVGIPLILDLFVLILSRQQVSLIAEAAKYRKYFDSYVLDIKTDLSDASKEKIKNDAKEYCQLHYKKSQKQINNTGLDKPPGIRNWYDLSNVKLNDNATFECQKQNIWWNERLLKIKAKVMGIIVIVFLVCAYVALHNTTHIAIIRFVLSSAIIVKAMGWIIEGIKYRKKYYEICGAITVVENSITQENIESLQNLINEMRMCNILGMNLIHKISAESLSKLYRARKE